MRQILLARKEAHVGAPLLRVVVADGAAQDRVARLERIEQRALGDVALDIQFNKAVAEFRERAQVLRELYPDHVSVCTSTESTAGRSRTIGSQWSPPSAEAYTWPPVVPK